MNIHAKNPYISCKLVNQYMKDNIYVHIHINTSVHKKDVYHNPYIKRIIYHDEMGFISGIQG